jgi:hypothetical protein
MGITTEGYLAFVVLGALLVIAVGQMLIRSGEVYLEEVFPDPRVAKSVSKLLAVLFYLFALGVLGITSTVDVPVEGTAQIVVTKLGVVLLCLGIVFGITMLVLSRIRDRREEQEKEEALLSAMPGVDYTPHHQSAHPVPHAEPAPQAGDQHAAQHPVQQPTVVTPPMPSNSDGRMTYPTT